MKACQGVAGIWWVLALGPLAAEDVSIPAHPSQLHFADRAIDLPSATGRRVHLEAGPVVYLSEDHSLPLVEISVGLRVGSFLDPAERTGLAFLTGSQIRRGGAAEMDADSFDNQVDQWGARLHSVSGSTRSGASLSVPTWALEQGIDLLFAMLRRPAFQEDRLEVSRGNLQESLTRRNEDALDILEREWGWLMYGSDHFTTRPITATGLAAIKRSDLLEFHRRYWRPEQMILAISGDFDRTRLLADLERRFAAWPEPEMEHASPRWPPPAPKSTAPPGLYHYEMDLPQAKVLLGHRFSDLLEWTSRDRFALAVVGEILGGGGAISRIAGRLRTGEGLVYRASAELIPGQWWPGEWRIFFESRGDSIVRATEAVLEELQRLQTVDVHPMELAVVQQTLEAHLRLDFDTAEEVSGYFAEDELIGRPHAYWRGYLEGVHAVTAEDVRRAAKTFLHSDFLTFLVVGRWEEISPGDGDGTTPLETLTGYTRIPLKTRDPLTMKVRAQD